MKTNGMYTKEIGKWRIQFYWMNFTITKSEFYVGCDTVVRFVRQHYTGRDAGFYRGAGFQILGFGIGIDYFRKDT